MQEGCLNCNGPKAKKSYIYCSNQCQRDFANKEYLAKWLRGEVAGGDKKYGVVSDIVKEYLFAQCENKCPRCGWKEKNEHTGRVPLQVEHINGDGYDHSKDNLTLLCPNCHSLTATYMGLNRGHGRKERREFRKKYDR